MTTKKPISIVIIEDHHEVRAGMTFMINSHPDFYCRAASNGEEALLLFAEEIPQVVLMDINLPGMDGIACTRIIREQYPEVLILICTVFETPEKIFNALKAGANGYVLKRDTGQTLIEAIRELLKGGAPMSSEIARKVVNSFREDIPVKVNEPTLTRRENDILELLAQGYGNKEIAEKLFVSLHTIRTHIYHIYDKLHVRNRVEALNKISKTRQR